jgi:hypothetical protein
MKARTETHKKQMPNCIVSFMRSTLKAKVEENPALKCTHGKEKEKVQQ